MKGFNMTKAKATKKAKYIRLMESMVAGKTFTEKQIMTTYKVASVRSIIYNIRSLGVNVVVQKDAKGVSRYSVV